MSKQPHHSYNGLNEYYSGLEADCTEQEANNLEYSKKLTVSIDEPDYSQYHEMLSEQSQPTDYLTLVVKEVYSLPLTTPNSYVNICDEHGKVLTILETENLKNYQVSKRYTLKTISSIATVLVFFGAFTLVTLFNSSLYTSLMYTFPQGIMRKVPGL